MTLESILMKHAVEWERFKEDMSDPSVGSSPMMDELYTHFCNNGEMPYGTMKARDGDPTQWIIDRLEREL